MTARPGGYAKQRRRCCNDASDALGKLWRERIDKAREVLRALAPVLEENEDRNAAHLRDAFSTLGAFVAEQDARAGGRIV